MKNAGEKTAIVAKKAPIRHRVIDIEWDDLVEILADILREKELFNDYFHF